MAGLFFFAIRDIFSSACEHNSDENECKPETALVSTKLRKANAEVVARVDDWKWNPVNSKSLNQNTYENKALSRKSV